MPVHKCSNGKYRIGEGPCMYSSKEKAEKAYTAYKAQKHDSVFRKEYELCKKRKIGEGFSEEEAEKACYKHIADEDEETEWDINVDFVDSVENVKEKTYFYQADHPDWTYEKAQAAAEGYFGLSKQEDAIDLTNALNRSTSLSLSRFSTLIKAIKTRHSLKAPHMGILPQRVMLPMKNLNRLQTKLEKLVTQEQKWLTAEQYEQRKQYARYMRKKDSKNEMTDVEFTDAINDLYLTILDHYPNLPADEAIDRAFMPPQGDNAWVVSNEAVIVSMNDGLNNIIKAPIILAKEMIQEYQIVDEETGEIRVEKHFKDFNELELAAQRIGPNGSLDIIIEHQDWYDANQIMGVVKQIRADTKTRTLRGMGYFYENKLPKGLQDAIKSGQIIPVSIGFLAKLGDGGEHNGVIYDHIQTNIHLRHLAILLDSVPRCPEGQCGVNLKDAHDNDQNKTFIIIKKPNYYVNICKIFKDSRKEKKIESSIKKTKEKEPMIEDSNGKIKGDEPSDLEAILTRLRKLLNDEGWEEEVKSNAIARILSALGIKSKGDNEMNEEEFNDAIAKKDSEIKDLMVKLEDQKKKIEKFEQEKKLNLIKQIKKFGDQYSDEELNEKDLNTLEIIADSVSRYEPSTKKPDRLPMKGADDKEEMEEKMKEKRIDFSKVFSDINKEFGLE